MFIYKEVSVKDLVPIFLDSAKGSAMILFIIATSTAFSWIFAYSGISGHLVHFIVGMNLNKTLFCLVVAVPPVAVNIFSAASVSKLKMGEIVKGQIPFFIGYIAVFLLVVLVPGFSHIFG